jgi:hypothetical protein
MDYVIEIMVGTCNQTVMSAPLKSDSTENQRFAPQVVAICSPPVHPKRCGSSAGGHEIPPHPPCHMWTALIGKRFFSTF